MENLNEHAANVFFHFSFTREIETGCLALWEGSEKGRGGWRLRSITWAQLLHLTTSIHRLHPPSAAVHTFGPAFLPDRPNTLSFQSGPSLHRLKTWAASLTTSALLPTHPSCPLFSRMCLTSTPSSAGELVLTVKPREGWKGQTCQAECYLNSSK